MQAVRSPAFALVDDDPCLRRGLGLGASEVLASFPCGPVFAAVVFLMKSLLESATALEVIPTVRTSSVAPHLQTEVQLRLVQEL